MEEAGRRFPSRHTKRESQNELTLLTMDSTPMFFVALIPPLCGAIIAVATALTVHQKYITNYNWMCGRAVLPSFSRIINLEFEGIVFQLFIYFHVPLRLLELTVGFNRYRQLMSVTCTWPRIYNLSRWAYTIFGTLEVVLMLGLSAVGEKEHGIIHIIFFYVYGFFALAFFITNTMCHSQSLYYLNPYGRLSYRLKCIFLGMYMISIPMIVTFYLLYWKACITIGYELFALTEYADAFISTAYHCCAFFDIRYKVLFKLTYCPRRLQQLAESTKKTSNNEQIANATS
ncbi:unnamed protein product [Auanema sp. JU1783]|nr:unnamed protein product [Auanema sp. JU1783]